MRNSRPPAADGLKTKGILMFLTVPFRENRNFHLKSDCELQNDFFTKKSLWEPKSVKRAKRWFFVKMTSRNINIPLVLSHLAEGWLTLSFRCRRNTFIRKVVPSYFYFWNKNEKQEKSWNSDFSPFANLAVAAKKPCRFADVQLEKRPGEFFMEIPEIPYIYAKIRKVDFSLKLATFRPPAADGLKT